MSQQLEGDTAFRMAKWSCFGWRTLGASAPTEGDAREPGSLENLGEQSVES